MRKNLFTYILLILSYLSSYIVVPKIFSGNLIFIINSSINIGLIFIITSLFKINLDHILKHDIDIVIISLIVSSINIFFSIFFGFFLGFGKNIMKWIPISFLYNFSLLFSALILKELSRFLIINGNTKKSPTTNIFLVSLFFAVISTPISRFSSSKSLLVLSEFLIKHFIPVIATNILATYLAYIGGFISNLTFILVPSFFNWFCPVLPKLSWQIESILLIISISIGFNLIENSVRLIPKRNARLKNTKDGSSLSLTVFSLIILLITWSISGLLGFTPTIIASGSMQPSLNTGDIVIIIDNPHEEIKVNDIIQYRTDNMFIVHRVIEIVHTGNDIIYLTKGDANNAADEPVLEANVIGKVIYHIPKLGWISISLKRIIFNVFEILLLYKTALYIVVPSVGIFTLYNYKKNQSHIKRLRRRK
jgi:signal peptidase